MPTLHGTPLSPFARKVLIALEEKNINFEHQPVVHFALPDGFEKLHPLRKIPVWTTDEGENIPDSSVIIQYLEATHPQTALTPKKPLHTAQAMFIEEFVDSDLAPTIAAIFLERIAAPLAMGREPDEALVDKMLSKKLPPLLAYLDQQIGEAEFVVGDEFSIADVAVASSLCNLRHTGIEIDVSKFPNLRRYADQIIKRPSIAKLFAAEVQQYGGYSPEAVALQQNN